LNLILGMGVNMVGQLYRSWLVASLLSATCFSGIARAEDSNVFGNIHFGGIVDAALDKGASDITVPALNVGGKFSYEPMGSQFGTQFDADYNYSDLAWISPSISGVKGSLSTTEGAAHLTYQPNDTSKLGVFAGYGRVSLNAKDDPGSTFDLFSSTGLTEATLALDVLGVGVEALVMVDDETWMQGRVGLIDPVRISATLSDGTTSTSDSYVDVLGDSVGFAIAGSVRHGFTSNFSMRGDLGYTQVDVTGDNDNLGMFNALATAQYTLDNMPISVAVTGGYARTTFDDYSQNGVQGSAKLLWSFGGPSSGTRGKLFRSGIFGLSN
jgi:hypothetical protein